MALSILLSVKMSANMIFSIYCETYPSVLIVPPRPVAGVRVPLRPIGLVYSN